MAGVFTCDKCGISVTTDTRPNTGSCAANPGLFGGHQWNKVGTVGESTYEIDYSQIPLWRICWETLRNFWWLFVAFGVAFWAMDSLMWWATGKKEHVLFNVVVGLISAIFGLVKAIVVGLFSE